MRTVRPHPPSLGAAPAETPCLPETGHPGIASIWEGAAAVPDPHRAPLGGLGGESPGRTLTVSRRQPPVSPSRLQQGRGEVSLSAQVAWLLQWTSLLACSWGGTAWSGSITSAQGSPGMLRTAPTPVPRSRPQWGLTPSPARAALEARGADSQTPDRPPRVTDFSELTTACLNSLSFMVCGL